MGFCFLGISFFLGRVSNFDMGLCKEWFFFFWGGFVFAYNYDVLCGFRSEENGRCSGNYSGRVLAGMLSCPFCLVAEEL